jgi:hypothetical protein
MVNLSGQRLSSSPPAIAAFEYVQKAYGWDRHAHTIARAIFGPELAPPPTAMAENLVS